MATPAEQKAFIKSASGAAQKSEQETGVPASVTIAQAILEELHDAERPGGAPKTIFATHYHELTALTDSLARLRTYRVDVLERGEDVVFLHAVVEGGADRSYGVHVARLAGVPERVTRRAAALLEQMEATPRSPSVRAASSPRVSRQQLSVADPNPLGGE